MQFAIAIGARVRKSPYFDRTVAEGVSGFSVYNHMYMPVSYGDPLAEYQRLVSGVAMWDVAVERQVELEGPDAETLARILTPRNLDGWKTGQGLYVPLCRHDGTIINDPVLLPLANDRFWLSIADSDICLWAQAVAAERGLDVTVREPDVSPLAVQGPKAVEVVASMFGDWVRELRYFGFREAELDGIPLVVARSGWSKQGGYELYLRDGTRGGELWDKVKEAGQPYGIGPGCPNYIERIESGLVSYGADTDDETTPYELGLGRWIDCDQEVDFIGKKALASEALRNPKRRFTGYFIDGEPAPVPHKCPVLLDGREAGFVSASCVSPRVGSAIGIGLVSNSVEDGSELVCRMPNGDVPVRPAPLPFKIG